MEAAFDRAKSALANVDMLVHPHMDSPITLTVDALEFAIGAVLEQWSETLGSLWCFTVTNYVCLNVSIIHLIMNCLHCI